MIHCAEHNVYAICLPPSRSRRRVALPMENHTNRSKGGFGAVYKVEDLKAFGAARALKSLKPNVNVENIEKRFEEEARALSALSHPGLPRAYEFGQDEELGLYYVLDFVEGQNLLDRIEGAESAPAVPMDVKERFRRAVEFFDVLEYVHSKGILHRDIKPENLMVPKSGGHLILLDFGIAKDLAASAVHTQTGVILGTPHYLTPEQLAGEKYTARSDLYQAGLVGYWLLTGGLHCFPQASSLAEVVSQRHLGAQTDTLERQPWFGRVATPVKLLLACVATNPGDRPGSAGLVRDALKKALETLAGPAAGAPATVEAPKEAPAAVRSSGRIPRPGVVAGAAKTSGSVTVVSERSTGAVRMSGRVAIGATPTSVVSSAGIEASAHAADAFAYRVRFAAVVVGTALLVAGVGMAIRPKTLGLLSNSTPTATPSSPADASDVSNLIGTLEQGGSAVHAHAESIFKVVERFRKRTSSPSAPPEMLAELAQFRLATRERDALRQSAGAMRRPDLSRRDKEFIAGALMSFEFLSQYCASRVVQSPLEETVTDILPAEFRQSSSPIKLDGFKLRYLKPEFFPHPVKEDEPQTIGFPMTSAASISRAAILLLGNRLMPEFIVSLTLNGHPFSLRSFKTAPFDPNDPREQADRQEIVRRSQRDRQHLWPNYEKDLQKTEAVGILGRLVPAHFLRIGQNTLKISVLKPAGPRHVAGPTIWQVIVATSSVTPAPE